LKFRSRKPGCFRHGTVVASGFARRHPRDDLEQQIHRSITVSMGNRAIWAFFWVIGVPLPVLVVLYFLTGGGCGN
jgi:hypothetical protein